MAQQNQAGEYRNNGRNDQAEANYRGQNFGANQSQNYDDYQSNQNYRDQTFDSRDQSYNNQRGNYQNNNRDNYQQNRSNANGYQPSRDRYAQSNYNESRNFDESRDFRGDYDSNTQYRNRNQNYARDNRDWSDKASDEMKSWFGDEDAARRRQMDDHRGKGPKGYKRSDSRIEEDVNDRLSDDHAVDASNVSVSVSDCEVTLDGNVDCKRAKRRAEDCCDSVSGVKHVQNNLRVNDQYNETRNAGNGATKSSRSKS